MEIAKVAVGSVQAVTQNCLGIPCGAVGAAVRFEFTNPVWDAFEKVAVFHGVCMRDVQLKDNMAVIPQEVIAKINTPVRVGIYGWNEEKGLAIPTLWAELGTVKSAADPSGTEAGDPEFAPWVELKGNVGDLQKLKTETKKNLVDAANELHTAIARTQQKTDAAAAQAAAALEDMAEAVEQLEKGMDPQRLNTMETEIAALKTAVPKVSAADNGKLLQIVNGVAKYVEVKDSSVATYIDDYISSALEGDY